MSVIANGIRNLFCVFISQSITITLSIVMAFLAPKMLGIKEFGYWQVFFFYSSYVGFFQFGFNDGIFLRYGGKEYRSLNESLFRTKLRILAISQLAISILLIAGIWMFVEDRSRAFSLTFAALCVCITGTTAFYWFVDQGTNRLTTYSIGIILDKAIFLILILAFWSLKIKNFKAFVIGNVFSRCCGLIYFILTSKEITFGKPGKINEALLQVKENISAGIKLMLANIAAMLMLGLGRIFVDISQGIESFGIFSLAMSITGFVLLLISSISIVLYPILRNSDITLLRRYFESSNCLLMLFVGSSMLLYLPIQWLIINWLPQYKQALSYLYLIFPLCFFQAKLQIILNTYYKALREETAMLVANGMTVLLCALLISLYYHIAQSLNAVVFAMITASLVCCIISEYYLKKRMGITKVINIYYDSLLAGAFILGISLFGDIFGSGFYLVALIIYIILNRKIIKEDLSVILKNAFIYKRHISVMSDLS